MSELTAVSLFAGIEGFGLALDRCGITVKASVEIDAECRGVIGRQFPGSKLFDDVRKVTGNDLRAAGFVPGRGVLTGGFPCQDLSVAGRRAGLGGARSGLFWEIVRLADELSPRWLVLENVPGLLSAVCSCPGDETCVDNGRAVRCGRWDKQDGKRVWLARVPHGPEGGACPGGCMELHGGAMGTVLGALGSIGYGFAYRVLDAQFFGVPQRRERVFIVGCLGDWAAPAEILLEPESGEGHSAARGKAGAHAADGAAGGPGEPRVTAPALTASAGTNHGAPGHGGKDEAVMAVTVATLQAGANGRGHRIDAEGAAGGHLIPVAYAIGSHAGAADADQSNRSHAHGGPVGSNISEDAAYSLRAGRSQSVAYALTARDGKGPDSDASTGFIMVPELAPPLTAEGHDASEDGTGRQALIPIAATLTSGAHSDGVSEPGRRSEDDTNLVGEPMAFNPQTGGNFRLGYGDKPTALSCTQATGIQAATAVRRLTPLERERLQGFPDDWTRWRLDADGREVEQSDSARDRQTGNAVAVPVVEWIAHRLVAADPARGSEAGAA